MASSLLLGTNMDVQLLLAKLKKMNVALEGAAAAVQSFAGSLELTPELKLGSKLAYGMVEVSFLTGMYALLTRDSPHTLPNQLLVAEVSLSFFNEAGFAQPQWPFVVSYDPVTMQYVTSWSNKVTPLSEPEVHLWLFLRFGLARKF